ncbi:MAG: hypothetical protein GY847_30800 [Proteobacteria bacterium]|nr:hypothetical protein [Pseudomonadota bacterium]
MAKLLQIEQALKLRSENSDDGRFDKYEVIKKELLGNEYIFTLHQFPGGNDHGPKHIQRVLEYLDKLVAGDPLTKLTDIELFILLCAAVFHDIGMIRGRKGHQREAQHFLGLAGYDFAIEDYVRDFIGQVLATHSSKEKIGEEFKGYDHEEELAGETIRLRYLAALLRLADELDEDFRRAKNRVFYNARIPEGSVIYWLINRKIQSVALKRDDQCIEVMVNYDNADIERLYPFELGHKVNVIAAIYHKMEKLNREVQYCMRFMEDGVSFRELKVTFRKKSSKRKRITIVFDSDSDESVPEELSEIYRQELTESHPPVDDDPLMEFEKYFGTMGYMGHKYEKAAADSHSSTVPATESQNWFDIPASKQEKIRQDQQDFVTDALEIVERPDLFGKWLLKVTEFADEVQLNLEFAIFDDGKTPTEISASIFPVGKYPLNPPQVKIGAGKDFVAWRDVTQRFSRVYSPDLWRDKYRKLLKRRLYHIAENIAGLQDPWVLFRSQGKRLCAQKVYENWSLAQDANKRPCLRGEYVFDGEQCQVSVSPTRIYPRKIPGIYCDPVPASSMWLGDGRFNWSIASFNKEEHKLWASLLNQDVYLEQFIARVDDILKQI